MAWVGAAEGWTGGGELGGEGGGERSREATFSCVDRDHLSKFTSRPHCRGAWAALVILINEGRLEGGGAMPADVITRVARASCPIIRA